MWFDNAAFFADFAMDITVNGVATRGIFDSAYGSSFSGMLDGSTPMLLILSSVPAARGNTVVVGAQSYVVTGVEPDGTGITLLRLERA